MKKLFIFALLAFAVPCLTGAAFIDKQTKKNVDELNYKYDRLMQLEHARHDELMKLLKEIRDLAAKKTNVRVVVPAPEPAAPMPAVQEPPAAPALTTPPAAASTEPAQPAVQAETPPEAPTAAVAPPPPPAEPVAAPAPEVSPPPPAEEPVAEITQAPEPAPEDSPSDEIPDAEPPAAILSDNVSSLGAQHVAAVTAPPPVTLPPAALPVIQVSMPEELTRQVRQSKAFSVLAILVALLSLGGMAYLIVTFRKSNERIRRMLWKTEVDHLREEVMGGRPHLKVERSYDRLTLTNMGLVTADDIKLSLGPAPGTMKHKLKVLARIQSGERTEVEIGPQTSGEQLFGTLEYKNPENGRIYKDQFILKIDSVTGEFIPIEQAS